MVSRFLMNSNSLHKKIVYEQHKPKFLPNEFLPHGDTTISYYRLS